jgi:hypothetical protein
MQESEDRWNHRGDAVYHMTSATGCDIIDLTELNTSEGCPGDSFMKFVEETSTLVKNKVSDPIRALMLNK